MKWLTFYSQRPGHDLRYALDGKKMERMGWTPKSAYEQLEHTIKWTLDNNPMVENLISFNY